MSKYVVIFSYAAAKLCATKHEALGAASSYLGPFAEESKTSARYFLESNAPFTRGLSLYQEAGFRAAEIYDVN